MSALGLKRVNLMKSNPFSKTHMIEYVYIYIGYDLELLQVMLGYRLVTGYSTATTRHEC